MSEKSVHHASGKIKWVEWLDVATCLTIWPLFSTIVSLLR